MIAPLLALIAPASAQEEEGCSTVYTADEFQTALDEADRLIGKAQFDRALNVLDDAHDLIPCLETVADRQQLADFGRNMALVQFYQQDEILATRWGRMFRYTAPAIGWGKLPEGHPLRAMVEEAGEAPIGGPADKGLVVPPRGGIFLNGTLARRPEARAEVPYLVQVVNSNGWPVKGYWQDGSAFPEEYLGEFGETRIPKFYEPLTGTVKPKGKPPSPGDDPYEVPTRGGSDLPVPQLAVAGGLVVASGVLYALAGSSHARITCNPAEREGCPTTPEELARAQTSANWLTLGAAVTFAGGVGVGVTGFIVEDSPGLSIGGRF